MYNYINCENFSSMIFSVKLSSDLLTCYYSGMECSVLYSCQSFSAIGRFYCGRFTAVTLWEQIKAPDKVNCFPSTQFSGQSGTWVVAETCPSRLSFWWPNHKSTNKSRKIFDKMDSATIKCCPKPMEQFSVIADCSVCPAGLDLDVRWSVKKDWNSWTLPGPDHRPTPALHDRLDMTPNNVSDTIIYTLKKKTMMNSAPELH